MNKLILMMILIMTAGCTVGQFKPLPDDPYAKFEDRQPDPGCCFIHGHKKMQVCLSDIDKALGYKESDFCD